MLANTILCLVVFTLRYKPMKKYFVGADLQRA